MDIQSKQQEQESIGFSRSPPLTTTHMNRDPKIINERLARGMEEEKSSSKSKSSLNSSFRSDITSPIAS